MRLPHLARVAVAAAALVLPGAASAAIDFTDRAPGRLIITTPAYRLSLSKGDGALVSLLDSSSDDVVLRGAPGGCLWRAGTNAADELAGACDGSFAYRWDSASDTLRLDYAG